MSIYLKIDAVEGSVTAKGYNGWIELNSVDFPGVQSHVANTVTSSHNRVKSKPNYSDVIIYKALDQASPYLFQYANTAESIDQIQIDYVTTADEVSAYATTTLENVIVSHYREHHSGVEPLEVIRLSYTKIQRSVIPRNQNNSFDSPIRTGYDLSTAEVM